MANKILCSTGTLVGRANGYDHTIILKNRDAVDADGFELMMLKAWYEYLPSVARDLEKANVSTPTIHFEKDVGALLGLGDAEDREQGIRLFCKNAEMAKAIGAEKAIAHLWDGRFSEKQSEEMITLLPTLYEICDRCDVELVLENVPCRVPTPFDLICRIAELFPNTRFTFDTRHGTYLGQCERFFESTLWKDRIGHLHISDYSGETVPGMWGVTRPILHPGEGIIDFEKLFALMPPYHGGTITLESPVIREDGSWDMKKLNHTLSYLREKCENC